MNIYLVIYMGLSITIVVNSKKVRIFGGENADLREFPYNALLFDQVNKLCFCGGAIISHWHILTAAHCFLNAKLSDVKIYVGIDTSKNFPTKHRKIESLTIHPKFDGQRKLSKNTGDDIAIVTVDICIPFNKFQKKIALPTANIVKEITGVFSGWGWTTYPKGNISENLQKVSLKILTNEECEEYYRFDIYEEQLCTLVHQGIGACYGDSGGPLVYNGQLVGISSFALPCAKGFPDVHTRVFKYLDFIRSNMALKQSKFCVTI